MLTRRSSDAAGVHHTVTRTVTGRMHARNSPAQSIPIPVTVHIQSRTEYVYPDVSSFPVPTVVYMLTLVNTPLLIHLKNRLYFLITESVSCLQGRKVRSVRFCGWCGKAGCGDEKKRPDRALCRKNKINGFTVFTADQPSGRKLHGGNCLPAAAGFLRIRCPPAGSGCGRHNRTAD